MNPPLPPEPFSQRFSVRPEGPPRKPNDVPESAKVRLVRLIDDCRQEYLPGAYSLGPRLADAVGRSSEGHGSMSEIRQLIQSLQWWEFYDICEELLRVSSNPEMLARKIDGLFRQHRLPYKITEAGIDWRLSGPADSSLKEAKRLLVSSAELQGPAQQFEKAQKHLAGRPPDPENCIKDAIGALEGVARIVSGDSSATFGQIIKPLSDRLEIHGALASAMSNLYGYRGDEGAIGHGTTQPLKNLIAEAELVLHWCAACIVYLAEKAK